MEVIVGHFGFLSYISDAKFTTAFPQEIVSFARKVVEKARNACVILQTQEGGQGVLDSNSEAMKGCTNFPLPLPDVSLSYT